MNIRFFEEDWERIERDWTLFWQGELPRPLVCVTCYDPASGSHPRKHVFVPQYGADMDIDEIIEIETQDLERQYFVGDTFPKFWLNFGAGSMAAYLGAKLLVSEHTIWFEPPGKELQDIEIEVDRQNFWYRRIHGVFDAALERWQGAVQVGFSDIGGNLDILASLRGTNDLLMDLYDAPDLIERHTQAITHAWKGVFQEEADKIQTVCRGTTPWGPLWSKGTTAFLQSDFSAMISPKMFERFVLPDIAELCECLDDPFFHLDGKGELPHLDMLLSLDSLKGVQWQPGAGQPMAERWPEVLKRIRDAGKRCQVFVTAEGAKRIQSELGGRGFIFEIVGEHDYLPDLTPEDAADLVKELCA